MAGVAVEAGSALAQAIQTAVQPKLIENGWVAEENDTTLSEYVTMMMVNGKDLAGVQSELGGDLLGVGEDDPAVIAFSEWLFHELSAMTAPPQQQQEAMPMQSTEMQSQEQMEDGQAQPIPSVQDSQMDDATGADGVPSGPKAMRSGHGAGRGRGGRMLGQINNHLNREREQSLPDPLRRIKGAASGQHGRIDSHAGGRGAPRGPKNNLANGVQRMMNGGGRGGRGGMNGSPMMQQNGGMANQLDPNQQMAFMQMMEMQANMMSQMMQNGQMPNFNQQQQGGKSLFDRVDKRQPNGHFKKHQQNRDGSQTDDAASSMDVDSKKDPFETTCRFNKSCTNPTCPFAHQTPAAPPGQTIDMTDTCSFGSACTNHKCVGRHPSPAQRQQHQKQEVDCKFFPNCTNPSCPFKHPDMPLCRNGADCSVSGCKFTHSKIMCRYSPCTRPGCPFKHVEGQRGIFKDKVWSAGADGVPDLEGEGTSERFAEFKQNESQAEELVLPGQQEGNDQSQLMHETQITT